MTEFSSGTSWEESIKTAEKHGARRPRLHDLERFPRSLLKFQGIVPMRDFNSRREMALRCVSSNTRSAAKNLSNLQGLRYRPPRLCCNVSLRGSISLRPEASFEIRF